MQALLARRGASSVATPQWLERMAAIVEAAIGYLPDSVAEIARLYRSLASRAEKVLLVLQREDDPEPAVIEVRCLEPCGPTERARELGLVLEIGGRCCIVYPGAGEHQ